MENIKVVPTSDALNAGVKEGVNQAPPSLVYLLNSMAECKKRDEVETDPTYLQLIPYVVIRTPSGYLFYLRAGSEGRLRGKWSVGFGGHVRCSESIIRALERELQEELGIVLNATKLTFYGTIYLPYNDVSSVHLGFLYIYDTTRTEFDTSDEIIELSLQKPPQLELWAQEVYKALGI